MDAIVNIVNTLPLELKILSYVVISMLLGAAVGLDRELADKPAGLRTHMLVAGSSALLVSLGKLIVPDFGLTPREIEVLKLLVEGLSDREIAESLFLSPRTVGWHVNHVLTKLDAPSRTAAATAAVRRGLV